jgi:hypothetical protein
MRITTSGAAAGTSGSVYRKILTYLAKAAGNYVFNETNFPGLGAYLPCYAVIALTPGAGGAALQVSSDNGTTWHALTTATTPFGGGLWLDASSTFRLVVTTNPTDIRIFVQ